MLNKELLDALNEQMNHEFYAAHAYMAMAVQYSKTRLSSKLYATLFEKDSCKLG
jgi:ferritin